MDDEGDATPARGIHRRQAAIAEEVDALHHQAHEACYIANSVKTEVVIEGQAEGLR